MLDVRGTIGREGQRGLFSATGLNTGLVVCADDVIIGTQWSTLPDALIKDRGWVRLLQHIQRLGPESRQEERGLLQVCRAGTG